MWLSPFTMLLRLYLDRMRSDTRSEQLKTLLKTVIRDSQVLRLDSSMSSLDTLVLSLQDSKDRKSSGQVLGFLDDCILRVVRKPVHYYDALANIIATAQLDLNPGDCQVDLLLIAILDQWPFLVKSADALTVTNVSKWLVRFIEVMNLRKGHDEAQPLRGKTSRLLLEICDLLKAEVQDTSCRTIFEKALKERPGLESFDALVAVDAINEARHISRPAGSHLDTHPKPPEIYLPPGPPEEHGDHLDLYQWTRHEVQDAISEGHVKGLLLCLCSRHAEIRKQGLTGARAFMMRLEVRSFTYPCN